MRRDNYMITWVLMSMEIINNLSHKTVAFFSDSAESIIYPSLKLQKFTE